MPEGYVPIIATLSITGTAACCVKQGGIRVAILDLRKDPEANFQKEADQETVIIEGFSRNNEAA